MCVLDGLSFIKPSPPGSLEYESNIIPKKELVDRREHVANELHCVKKRVARKQYLLQMLLKKKQLLQGLINRNQYIEQTSVNRINLSLESRPITLSKGNLSSFTESIQRIDSFKHSSKISIHFWIFPLSRNASLVLENEGNKFAIRSSKEIEFHDYSAALSLLFATR